MEILLRAEIKNDFCLCYRLFDRLQDKTESVGNPNLVVVLNALFLFFVFCTSIVMVHLHFAYPFLRRHLINGLE